MNCATISIEKIAMGITANQNQFQTDLQLQKMSQQQIQTLKYLAMGSKDLREEILKAVDNNPALEIVFDPFEINYKNSQKISSSDNQNILEQTEDKTETLQQHLINQVNLEKLSEDEHSLCIALIQNLDKNGCYGSMLDPVTLLDKNRPQQNRKMLSKCMDLIHHLDPVGVCCKTPEESLLIQAQVKADASELTLFLLNNHLELLVPPVSAQVQKNIKKYLEKWHSQSFAAETPIDNIPITIEEVQNSIDYIRNLNPHPAAAFAYDENESRFNQPDVVLTVEPQEGYLREDDFENGKIKGTDKIWFQVKYASGILPEIRLNPVYSKMPQNKKYFVEGKEFIQSLMYRKNTIALQGCAIVSSQKKFFLEGKGNLVPLTRRQLAKICNIHESTVSRMANKKNSKYIQCQWGIFPADYFFTSGIDTNNGKKISSETIKSKLSQIIEATHNANLSDSQLTQILNQQGIKIARRTVTKYRTQLNIQNSYQR